MDKQSNGQYINNGSDFPHAPIISKIHVAHLQSMCCLMISARLLFFCRRVGGQATTARGITSFVTFPPNYTSSSSTRNGEREKGKDNNKSFPFVGWEKTKIYLGCAPCTRDFVDTGNHITRTLACGSKGKGKNMCFPLSSLFAEFATAPRLPGIDSVVCPFLLFHLSLSLSLPFLLPVLSLSLCLLFPSFPLRGFQWLYSRTNILWWWLQLTKFQIVFPISFLVSIWI